MVYLVLHYTVANQLSWRINKSCTEAKAFSLWYSYICFNNHLKFITWAGKRFTAYGHNFRGSLCLSTEEDLDSTLWGYNLSRVNASVTRHHCYVHFQMSLCNQSTKQVQSSWAIVRGKLWQPFMQITPIVVVAKSVLGEDIEIYATYCNPQQLPQPKEPFFAQGSSFTGGRLLGTRT